MFSASDACSGEYQDSCRMDFHAHDRFVSAAVPVAVMLRMSYFVPTTGPMETESLCLSDATF
jgi:hypothetical protein